MVQHLLRALRNYFKDEKIYDFISKKEIKRLLVNKRFVSGHIEALGRRLSYSDNVGLMHSLEEIFVEECYKFYGDNPNPVILDCGSNIGLSIIYFKTKYPTATIIGFEPDKKIFRILQENLSSFELTDVILYNKAVSIDNNPISFFSEGSLAGSVLVDFGGANQKTEIEAIRLKDFLNQQIDFLKIDIEGSENDVIFDLIPELNNVKQIFIEYHSIPNVEQKLSEILAILRDAGFKYYIKLAADVTRYPFIEKPAKNFDMQLNIFGYRNLQY